LGWPSVAWGLQRISSHELAEWQAYAQVEPFGDERADLRAAIIACTIANAHRDPEQHPEPFTPADFMPHFGLSNQTEAEAGQSIEQQMALLNVFMQAYS